MAPGVPGIHHITAIASDPQANLDFYAGVLGLRFLKKTVNFDMPDVYHLYYGDDIGRPGTILTFFPSNRYRRGRAGAGQTTAIAMAIPAASVGFWSDWLQSNGVAVEGPHTRFDEGILTLSDPDGIRIELVATGKVSGDYAWERGPVPLAHAIRGTYGVTLTLDDIEPSAALLTDVFGFSYAGESGGYVRYTAQSGKPGTVVDLLRADGNRDAQGVMGAGAIHHVAWRASDDAGQLAWKEHLASLGVTTTPVRDRQYFRSIYFSEPGGVLFEIATDGPGFSIDEPVEDLGTSLKLPPWYEDRRAELEKTLPSLSVR